MKKLKQKGFTLIELMIVLAIIAILAVVLVPKAAQMKDNSRNSGVVTNVNAVRGVLEAKVVDTKYLGSAANTRTLLNSTFTGDNDLVNPLNSKGTGVDAATDVAVTTAATSVATDSIVVYAPATLGAAPALSTITGLAPASGNKGIVYVYVYTDGYAVFGVDSTGNVVNASIIK